MSTTTRSVIVRLRAEMAQFKKEWKDGASTVKQTKEELDAAAKKAKEAGKAIDDSGTAVGRASKNLREHRSAWDEAGTSMLRTGAVVVAAGALMAKAAIDWETAWAGVTKTVNGTPGELAKVEDGLRSLARSMPESHTQIAAVAEAAGQLGVRTEDIVGFTRNMVMLGDTTNLTADEAATSIAQLMNVMQTAPGDVDRLSSTLVALGNAGASTERDIIQMAQRIAGAGEIVGMSEANVLSLANALASSGIEVEAGGSAISSVLMNVAKAVDTGSDKLDLFAEVAGTTATDFASKWKADPASALADFTEGLGDLSAKGENVFGVLDSLGMSDIRVTRALLNMANAGDLLRDSLADGDVAWQRNNALVQEAEKRYDTTAAKIKIAWNNIKDNAIDAGQAMLPALSALSDVVSALASAFGKLPDPVKAGLGAITMTSGLSLVAVGGFMKIAGSVHDTREAFKQLEGSTSKTVRGIGQIGKVAGIAAAGLTAMQVAGALIGDSGAPAGVNKFTKAILGVAQNAKGAKGNLSSLFDVDAPGYSGMLYRNIKGIGDALDEAADGKGLGDRTADFLGFDTRVTAATKSVDQLDTALAGLVQGGATKEAAAGFEYLTKVADEQGIGVEKLKKLFPQYTDSLDALKVQQELSGDSTAKLSEQTTALGARLAELSPDAKEAQKILDEMNQSTIDAAMGFIDLAKEIDTSKTSFSNWLKDLEAQEKAMESWGDNLIKAAHRGVSDGVIKEFEKMGPEGAKRLAELVDASDEEIARLNKVFDQGGASAEALAEVLNALPSGIITDFSTPGAPEAVGVAVMVAEKYGIVPDQVRTILEALNYTEDDIAEVLRRMGIVDDTTAHPKIRIDSGNAFSIINGIQTSINRITGKTVYVKVKQQGGTPGGILSNAEGGAIVGQGGPREDNMLSWVSNGEHVWTAAEVAAIGGQQAMYAMRAAVRAGNRPKFADGGAADDAWNQSYRTAAASYGAPVRSQQAPAVAGQGGPSVLGVDVSGVRVGYDADLRPILQGEIQVAINGTTRQAATTNRRQGRSR